MRLITNRIRNTTNKIFAIPADAAAIPPNPKIAAIIAITRNTHAYQSILYFSSGKKDARLRPFAVLEAPAYHCAAVATNSRVIFSHFQ
jgi:hypothetical protein